MNESHSEISENQSDEFDQIPRKLCRSKLEKFPALSAALEGAAIRTAARLKVAKAIEPEKMQDDQNFLNSLTKELSAEAQEEIREIMQADPSLKFPPNNEKLLLIIFGALFLAAALAIANDDTVYPLMISSWFGAAGFGRYANTQELRRKQEKLFSGLELDVDPAIQSFYDELFELAKISPKGAWNWHLEDELDKRVVEIRMKAFDLDRMLRANDYPLAGPYRTRVIDRVRVFAGDEEDVEEPDGLNVYESSSVAAKRA